MPFATLPHLTIRALRCAPANGVLSSSPAPTSDAAHWLALRNDPFVLSGATLGYPVPSGPGAWKTAQEWLENALFVGVVEVRKEFAGMGRQLPEEDEGQGPEPEPEPEANRFIGFVLLTVHIPKNRDAELGLMLARRWHGLGFGTELVGWVVGWAFDQLGMHRVSLEVVQGNGAAKRVYEKVGFVEEGRKRKAIWQDGAWSDLIIMGILDEDWRALEQSRKEPG